MFRRLQGLHQGVYTKICQYSTSTSYTEFALFVRLFIYLPDDDLVQVETCRRHMNYYYFYNWPFGC
jgi:hypothetical protein